MSLRLKLYSIGSRIFLRTTFSRVQDAALGGARLDRMAKLVGALPPYTLALSRVLGDRPGHWLEGRGSRKDRIVLYFHGGAYFAGSGKTHAPMLAYLSHLARVPVFAQDYRLLQEAPCPAAHEDAVAAWDDLISRGWEPNDIAVGGDSAGGGLALALLSTLCLRGTPPACAFAMSPWTDLTLSGTSIKTRAKRDPVLPSNRIAEAAEAYLGALAPDDPRASPLFASFPNSPPVFLQVGSPEILEDDTYRIANRLREHGADVVVETWDGAPHGWQLGYAWLPEARSALKSIANFVQSTFESARR